MNSHPTNILHDATCERPVRHAMDECSGLGSSKPSELHVAACRFAYIKENVCQLLQLLRQPGA